MLKTITIAENSLEPETWKTFECEDILEFLTNYFKVWPTNARIYNKNVCEVCDVTPTNEKDIENLLTMQGPFYVIIYPGWAWVPYIVMALVAVVMIATMPKVPNAAIRAGSDTPSSNNELSDRTNKSRINARIPDIYGQVRSVPDLIALPYKVFENNVEIEYAYMCIGRGEFEINDVKDDTTLINNIKDCRVEVYSPFTSPNSGDEPQLRIGKTINSPILKVKRFNSVNGLVLGFESKNGYYAYCIFGFNKTITINSNDIPDLRNVFSVGENINITDAAEYEEHPPDSGIWRERTNYNGLYTISGVAEHFLTISNAESNVSWQHLIDNSLNSNEINTFIEDTQSDFYGPFVIDDDTNEEIWINFVAENGLYKDDGTTKTAIQISFSIEITPIDIYGNAIGQVEKFTKLIIGKNDGNLYIGETFKIKPTFKGRSSIKIKRTTPTIIESGKQIYQEVKWRDLYSASSISKENFGNVTTIQSKTISNTGSLSTKERKLNCLVTRKIPLRISGETFSTVLYATKRADEIIAAICLDPKIGNRNVSELDLDNIYSTIAEINSYFGTNLASEFCYTFDSALSFEETLSSVANAIFCLAYRRGSKIKLSFEKKNNIPTILFNHRNKIPGSETRSVTFGNVNDNDGVEFQYVDPRDDAIVSIYVPSDKSAVNPKIVESIGIRNFRQAHFNAMRIYNKILNQTTAIEFEATQECNICAINDRILVSDGTRLGSFEGEVIAQNILELELSQNVELLNGTEYTIFLQKYDGTIESIPITKTNVKNKVLLNHAPSFELVTGFDAYAKTTFIITSNDDTRKTSFILTEKKPKGVMTANLTAMNYTDLYYQNDTDYINNIIS